MMSMFRDSHPLEVALVWTLAGVLFSLYFFIKLAPKGSLSNQDAYPLSSGEQLMFEQFEERVNEIEDLDTHTY